MYCTTQIIHVHRTAQQPINYELTETPDIHEHDVFCDCKPEEYEVKYLYAFATYLQLPAFGRFQGKRVLVVAFPRENQAVAKVTSVEMITKKTHSC